jgi:glycosyltransferase involved in cell wall biosynthesis
MLLAARLVKAREDYRTAVFFLGTQYQIPILLCRLMGKRVVCGSAGLGGDFAKYNYGRLAEVMALALVNFNYWLADVILVESWRLAADRTLDRWRRKLRLGTLHLSYPEQFKQTVPIALRPPVIGFIGRFSPEKGVLRLIEAAPALLEKAPDTRILLIGSGRLQESMRLRIAELGIAAAVTIEGWVEHQDLPDYLNGMRMLVVPSESEGIPNVVMEAFGCGTAVAAAEVGGIPDLVQHDETGFLIRDFSPAEMGRNLAAWLSDPVRLERIAAAACRRLESDYLLASAIDRYGRILVELQSA